ncbi:MAG: Long-chain acyl-CoA thioesterase FadM [Chloroflexi bacterium]|nr:Long-chain acyl-CoA thioesterase FadM [Chloroflexota bacterium]
MPKFHFSYPITVRYSDLDPQGHVNNACYLSYFEHGRVAYIQHLELWDGKSFLDLGFVLANAKVDFKAPILMADDIQVRVRVSRLGGKSLEMEYEITTILDEKIFATGSTTMVAYDYRAGRAILIPSAWREEIVAFEKIKNNS